MHHTTEDGRSLRLMTLVDEFSGKCLAIKVGRRLNSMEIIEMLADAMLEYGIPMHIRSDNVLNARGISEKGENIPAKRI